MKSSRSEKKASGAKRCEEEADRLTALASRRSACGSLGMWEPIGS